MRLGRLRRRRRAAAPRGRQRCWRGQSLRPAGDLRRSRRAGAGDAQLRAPRGERRRPFAAPAARGACSPAGRSAADRLSLGALPRPRHRAPRGRDVRTPRSPPICGDGLFLWSGRREPDALPPDPGDRAVRRHRRAVDGERGAAHRRRRHRHPGRPHGLHAGRARGYWRCDRRRSRSPTSAIPDRPAPRSSTIRSSIGSRCPRTHSISTRP